MEELLAQIRALLDEYLAQGGDTPVAAEAQALASAIDGTMGGGPDDMGGMPAEGMGAGPEAGMMPPPEAGMMPPEGEEPPMEEIPPGDQAGNFADASAGALDFLKKRKTKAL